MAYVARTREQIILKVKGILDLMPSLSKVIRRVPSYESLAELQQLSALQFPLVAIEAGLPIPDEKESARFQGRIPIVISELPIKLYCYLLDNDDDTMDTSISTMLSTLWAALLANPTLDEYALSMRLVPNADIEFWHPFVAFQIVVNVKYTHSTGEI